MTIGSKCASLVTRRYSAKGEQMIIAGIILIGLAGVMGLGVAIALFMGKFYSDPRKYAAIGLLLGIVFAIAGLLLYLAA